MFGVAKLELRFNHAQTRLQLNVEARPSSTQHWLGWSYARAKLERGFDSIKRIRVGAGWN